MTERLKQLSALEMNFDGQQYIGFRPYNKDFNMHHTEIQCDTEEQWNAKIERLKTVHQTRKDEYNSKILFGIYQGEGELGLWLSTRQAQPFDTTDALIERIKANFMKFKGDAVVEVKTKNIPKQDNDVDWDEIEIVMVRLEHDKSKTWHIAGYANQKIQFQPTSER